MTDVRCGGFRQGLMCSDPMNLKHPHHRPHAHHSSSLAAVSTGRSAGSKRRSSRMALNAAVGLTGEDRQKATFTANAKATNLNRHGAAVQISRELLVGSVLTVKNQRGTQISARVVAQLATQQGVPTYAIEFVGQDDAGKDFWGISFPAGGNN